MLSSHVLATLRMALEQQTDRVSFVAFLCYKNSANIITSLNSHVNTTTQTGNEGCSNDRLTVSVHLKSDSLIGAFATAPDSVDSNTTWVGSPPLLLPSRTKNARKLETPSWYAHKHTTKTPTITTSVT